MEARCACGSMVLLYFFAQNICTKCKCFVQKNGFFRYAEGGTIFQVSDCVTPVIHTSYAVTNPKRNFASGRVEDSVFFTEMLHIVQHFCEKDKRIPCCRRRRLSLWEYMSDLYAHCVTPVNNTRYAVTNPKRNFASGRAVPDILFQRIFARCAKIL